MQKQAEIKATQKRENTYFHDGISMHCNPMANCT